jgi:hypothetical protein
MIMGALLITVASGGTAIGRQFAVERATWKWIRSSDVGQDGILRRVCKPPGRHLHGAGQAD